MRELNEVEIGDLAGAGPLLAVIHGAVNQTFQAGVALGGAIHEAVCRH